MDFLTLKKSNCKNCHKCIRNCPVKSIRFTGNQAYIIGDADDFMKEYETLCEELGEAVKEKD